MFCQVDFANKLSEMSHLVLFSLKLGHSLGNVLFDRTNQNQNESQMLIIFNDYFCHACT